MSTYSDLKILLIGTGEEPGTWGSATNVNLGTALEEAIVGTVDVTFASGDVTLTLTNTNATQTARHLRLRCTGTTGGARNLILGSGCQIGKPYIVSNTCSDAIVVKNTTGTGISVPAGKSMWVYNDGTNVVDAVTHLTSLTLGSALPVASGGTGVTSLGSGVVTWMQTPSSANLAAAVTDETGSGSLVFATSPTLVTPTLGVATATSLNKVTVTAPATSATLTLANGSSLITSGGNSLTMTTSGTTNVTLPAETFTAGYKGTPLTGGAEKTSNYTLVAGDVGKSIQLGASGAVTINDSVFAAGDVVVIVNNTNTAKTITTNITNAFIAGSTTDKSSVSLAAYGIASVMFTAADTCLLSGNLS